MQLLNFFEKDSFALKSTVLLSKNYFIYWHKNSRKSKNWGTQTSSISSHIYINTQKLASKSVCRDYGLGFQNIDITSTKKMNIKYNFYWKPNSNLASNANPNKYWFQLKHLKLTKSLWFFISFRSNSDSLQDTIFWWN